MNYISYISNKADALQWLHQNGIERLKADKDLFTTSEVLRISRVLNDLDKACITQKERDLKSSQALYKASK